MLQSIKVAGEASYSAGGQTLDGLRQVNFIYGANGSGKTTISRVIASPADYPDCSLTWNNGRPLETLVYNRDFIERNYVSQMRGIFTLGEEDAAALANLAACRKRCDQLEAEIASRRINLEGADGQSGKVGELAILRRTFEDGCWQIKTRHDGYFEGAFKGYRNSRSAFCDKVLEEFRETRADLKDLAELKSRATSVFANDAQPLPILAFPDATALLAMEAAPILSQRIVGKEDIDIAALIRKLESSDWVRQGLRYAADSEGVCPFCQQALPDDLRDHIAEYFDEDYTQAILGINSLAQRYEAMWRGIVAGFRKHVDDPPSHLDTEMLKQATDALEARFTLNQALLMDKIKTPSASVTLHSTQETWHDIFELFRAANVAIQAHNDLIANQATEKASLTRHVWRFVVEEAGVSLVAWNDGSRGIEGAISGLTQGINERTAELRVKRAELQALERGITSVEPTVNAINDILGQFGFSNFRLATSTAGENLYAIVRADGTDATTTLSEGERTFITFLYFYHLIRGSTSSSGMTTDRVIVFDDPVSSLDSDVLFIVSTLIKRIIVEACEGAGLVKQVFVLTHNIYFHKEVTYDKRRADVCLRHETFWIVKKAGEWSIVERFDRNPIKTSYQLLWSEVRNPNRSTMTIQNTLRRILENYFKILGNIDRDGIVVQFTGRDQQICASLFSWVNDGSHAVHDDLYISTDATIVETYLRVFKSIFEVSGHSGHYHMMLGEDPENRLPSGSEESPQGEAA